MILKFVSRTQQGSELFLEYTGQILVESNIGNVNFNETYGNYIDKVITLRHYYGLGQDFVLGVDSSNYAVYLLNNQGQNIQRLM